MVRRKSFSGIRIVLIVLLLMSYGNAVQAVEENKDPEGALTVMTQAELQSQVMAFADRYFGPAA